jgi:hypothetical protein
LPWEYRVRPATRTALGIVLLITVVVLPSWVTAQDSLFVEPRTHSFEDDETLPVAPPPHVFRHAFLFTASFVDEEQSDDTFLGGAYRFIALPSLDLGLLLAFSARLDEVYTLEPLRPRLWLQRQEDKRFLVSLSIDKAQTLWKWFGVYGALGAGYSWGKYAGTDVDPESKWTAVGDLGLTGRFGVNEGRLVLRIGYQYADRVTSDKNTIYLAIGVGI